MSLSELSLTVNPSGSSPISQLQFKAPLFSNHEIVNLSNPNLQTEVRYIILSTKNYFNNWLEVRI
jgi:hypothetical protein